VDSIFDNIKLLSSIFESGGQAMEGTTECPRCSHEITFETEGNEDGSIDVTCEECEATLSISYSFALEIDGAEIVEVPSAEFDCTECSTSLEISDIEDESGSEEVECDNCNARLEVSWSHWGQQVDAQLIEPGPSEEGDGDDDEDEEEEEKKRDEMVIDDDDEEEDSDEDDFDEDEDDEDF
jgi:hypothetical protein